MSAVPPPYDRQFNFETYQQNNPTSPLPGIQVDAELNHVKTSLDATQSRLAQIQRDDGQLANAIVTSDSLSANVLTILVSTGAVVRGAWVTATAYSVKDIITTGGSTYICAVAHTSAALFSTDLAAGKWVILATNLQGTAFFANTAARTAATPAFTGQVGVQLDTQAVYTATSLVAGGWTIQPITNAQLADGTITMAKLTSAMDLSAKTVTLANNIVTTALINNNAVTYGKLALNIADYLPGFSGLYITSTGGTSAVLTADYLCLLNSTSVIRFSAIVSATISFGTSGAGGIDTGAKANSTFYHIWAISNGTLLKGMFSLSSTAPTMPSGYTYKMLLGAVLVNDAGNIVPFQQFGRAVTLLDKAALFTSLTGVTSDGNINLYSTTVSAGNGGNAAIPPTASHYSGIFGRSVASALDWNMSVRTIINGGANVSPVIVGAGRSSAVAIDGFSGSQTFTDLPAYSVGATSGRLAYIMGATTASAFSLYITGYRYNL